MTDQLIPNLILEIKELNKTHHEILTMLSILTQPNIEERLTHIFSNSKELLAYRLSDGKTSSKEIGEKLNVSHTTITNWWKKWEEKYKIVKTEGYKNPYIAIYSLPELVLLFGETRPNEE